MEVARIDPLENLLEKLTGNRACITEQFYSFSDIFEIQFWLTFPKNIKQQLNQKY